MKKLLTILTGLSVTITPATQIVSCKITVDNTYRNPSDIQKFWNHKMFSTISVDPKTIDILSFENDLKALISNNFKNQNEVNEILGLNLPWKSDDQSTRDGEKIIFEYYSSQSGQASTKINDLSDYLTSNLNEKNPATTIYFKYKIGEEALNGSALKLNVTTSPKMAKGVFSGVELSKETLRVSPIYSNDLKIRIGSNKSVDRDFLEKNSDVTIQLLKGILNTIKMETGTTLLNDLQWVKNQNPHSQNEIPYLWKLITPEEQMYKLLMNESNESLVNFVNKVVIENGTSNDLNSFLGLSNDIRFQLG
ncbi:lipoprotein [Spiroplasma monobiae]|uniref:Lipoprotein n=1 Tax=Spiroplasma monobiae MQ-1 TaxID=1336748 RepID=A0A2K9LUG5_SPISQ|nr:lipoprotein [Spiroplasma monobiae]AUM62670.1 hypothetical protein SMONO_v1c04210 [Spiroplasma monobiae MQ-1]